MYVTELFNILVTHHFHIAMDSVSTCWCRLTGGHRTPDIVRMHMITNYLQVWFQNKPNTTYEKYILNANVSIINNTCVYVAFQTVVTKHNSACSVWYIVHIFCVFVYLSFIVIHCNLSVIIHMYMQRPIIGIINLCISLL